MCSRCSTPISQRLPPPEGAGKARGPQRCAAASFHHRLPHVPSLYPPNHVLGGEAMAAISINPILLVLAISASPGHCAVTAGLSPSWAGSPNEGSGKGSFRSPVEDPHRRAPCQQYPIRSPHASPPSPLEAEPWSNSPVSELLDVKVGEEDRCQNWPKSRNQFSERGVSSPNFRCSGVGGGVFQMLSSR